MTRLRSLLRARRWLALAVVALAMAVRIVVPAGMMPGFGPHGATLVVCSGVMETSGATAGSMPGMTMSGAVPGMTMSGAMPLAAKGDAGKSDPAKADAPCAYIGLLAASLATADLPHLPAMPLPAPVGAMAVLLAVVVGARRLRPPLRGPPALAAA